MDRLKKETYHESKENTEEKAFINNWLKPPVTFVYWPVQTTPQSQVFLIYEPFILSLFVPNIFFFWWPGGCGS